MNIHTFEFHIHLWINIHVDGLAAMFHHCSAVFPPLVPLNLTTMTVMLSGQPR